jgi:phage minor structural protein
LLGDIDINLRLINPQIFIAKPNREIIAKVSEAYGVNRSISLESLFTVSFKIPFYIEQNSELVRNRNVDIIKERYHIKVQNGDKIEWYIVTKIVDVMDSKGDSKEIQCIYLPQELSDKLIGRYAEDAKNAREVLNDILSVSVNWSIDYIDADFELSYRTFEFPDNTLLDAINSVATTYNAIIEWNTVDRKLSLIKPEFHGINRLGTLSYQKYLKSIDKESNAEVVVTRLIPEGKDGLSIERINPTGKKYIEDYSFFLYPFERDNLGNVIKQSHYMSDSLCNALLDYKVLVEANEGYFGTLIGQRDVLTDSLSQRTIEVNDLKNELATITQIQLAQQFDGTMFFEKFSFTGATITKTFAIDNLYQYAVLVKVDDVVGKTLTINGQASYMMNGTWVLSTKINSGITPINISISGTGSTGVFIQVVLINTSEYATASNEIALVEKYNFDNKEMQITAKNAQITLLNSQIVSNESDIDTIIDILSIANNFTSDQWSELDEYVFVQRYNDDKFIEDTDLFKAAKEKFNELNTPQLSLKIDIVNFLSVLEEQRNWSQLYLGDKVIVKYEIFDLKIEAKIIQIDYGYEDSSISLTLAHFKDITTNRIQMEKFMSDAKNTISIVDNNKPMWDKAIVDTSEFSNIFEKFWDKITNQINMAINQTVQIDDRGVTITDSHDPLRFLRLTNGQVGLTRSGGLRYETAISADGIIAEMVLGKLILGQRVTIGDADGIWMTEGSKTTITDRCGRVAMKLGLYETSPNDLYGMVINRYDASVVCSPDIVNKIIVNSEDGFKIQRKKISTFDDVLYTSLDGDLFMKGNFQAGEDEQIFKVTHTGLQLGGSDWATAPLHADMFGNVWMNKLFADDAEILNSVFKDGHIEGSDITLRDDLGGVMKLFPEYGMWFGTEDFNSSIASIGMDGTATFKKLIVKNGLNSLMIDSDAGFIDFSSFDILAGYLEAENIKTDIISADMGIINDLTVSRVVTRDVVNPTGSTINYIKIEGNTHQWITATASGANVQAETLDGKLLYYEFGTTDRLTIKATNIQGNPNVPVMVKDYQDKRVKMDFSFYGEGASAFPVIQMGQGSSTVNDNGKAFIKKPDSEWEFLYLNRTSGNKRRMLFNDDGITVTSEGGVIKIEHNSGSYFEIGTNGNDITMNHKTAGSFKIDTTGLIANITGDINMTASGQFNFSGTQYNFA